MGSDYTLWSSIAGIVEYHPNRTVHVHAAAAAVEKVLAKAPARTR